MTKGIKRLARWGGRTAVSALFLLMLLAVFPIAYAAEGETLIEYELWIGET